MPYNLLKTLPNDFIFIMFENIIITTPNDFNNF